MNIDFNLNFVFTAGLRSTPYHRPIDFSCMPEPFHSTGSLVWFVRQKAKLINFVDQLRKVDKVK